MPKTFKKRYLIIFLIAVCFVTFFVQVPIFSIYNLPEQITMCVGDLEYINKNNVFGKFVKLDVAQSSVKTLKLDNENPSDIQVEFKLFNLIPIKKQSVKMLGDKDIYVGGAAVGLVLKNDGALVVGSSAVDTKSGSFDICKETSLRVGDVITHINDQKVESTTSISKYLNNSIKDDQPVLLKCKRGQKGFNVKVKPAYDINTNTYRLGVWVRDDASGIGTLTYINSNNRFGALGHPICDLDTKTIVDVKDGGLYNCSVLGVNKGVSGSPGEIKGLFMQGKNQQGYIDKNNTFGVFGEVKDDSTLFDMVKPIKAGGRFSVRPGKAQIRCCIDGNNIKMFDVEIIKTNYQNYSDDKSMVIRVIDKELLQKTGGIVQGMSGSPIIQDGKLVGAVTHVFVNDPTKGYGVYLDWMINE